MAPVKGWWYQHKALVGYLILVLVSVGGALLYQSHTVHILRVHDEHSCAQRNKLAANQRFVFETLELLLIRNLNQKDVTPGGAFALQNRLATLEAKLPDVGPEAC